MSVDLLQNTSAWLKTHWVKVVGGILAAVLLLALVAPYLLDVDRYRGRISDLISIETGRQVTLGRLRATILPRVGFSVDGFQMANPPDFPQGQLVRAEEIHGALAFWPLVLRRELRVISLALIEPRLTLLEDDRGRNNYTFAPRTPAASLSALQTSAVSANLAPISASSSASLTLMIDQVTMSHAAVFYGTVDRRGRTVATVHVSDLDLELRQLALQPLHIRQWEADASLGGAQLSLAGWNTPVLFDSGTVILREGKLDSSFILQFGKAARVEGMVTVLDIENPAPQFDLKTANLDLDALLAGTAEPVPGRANFNFPSAAPGPRRDGGPWSTGATASVPVPASLAPSALGSRIVANGHLAAARISRGKYTAGPLTADLRIFNDRTEIWPFTLRLAGGAVQLTARTDRLQVPQRFSANVQVRELNTERILHDSPDFKGKLAGAADLDLQLIGSLEPRWIESLTGKGQFVIRNGRIAGFNLTGAAQSLAKLAGVAGDTPFTRLVGDLDIRNQRITSRQIHMDSPRGTLDLKGRAGFYGSIDYKGQMIVSLGSRSTLPSAGILGEAIARNLGPTQITVPFVVRGTLQQPQIRPGRTAPTFSQASRPAQPGQAHQPDGFGFPGLFGQ